MLFFRSTCADVRSLLSSNASKRIRLKVALNRCGTWFGVLEGRNDSASSLLLCLKVGGWRSVCGTHHTCSGGCVRDTIWHGEVVGLVCGTLHPVRHITHVSTLPSGPSTQLELLSLPFPPCCALAWSPQTTHGVGYELAGSVSVGCWLQLQGWCRLTIVGFTLGPWWCW